MDQLNNNQPSKKFRPIIILVLFLSILSGVISGILGELLLDQYILPQDQYTQRSLDDLTRRLEDLNNQKQKSLKDILSENDLQFNQAINNALPAVVDFYHKKESSQASLVENIYFESEKIGQGFIFTSDGWIMTTKQVIDKQNADNFVVFVNKNQASIENIVFDPSTQLTFVKVKAENLPVIGFGELDLIAEGMTVMVLSGNQVYRTSLNSLDYYPYQQPVDYVYSTEKLQRYMLLADELDSDLLGSPVINNDGQIIGVLVNEKGYVLPIDFVKSVVKSLFDQGIIIRNYLGVHYIDLAEADIPGQPEKGALLISYKNEAAVKQDSPAAMVGLRDGDIITKVNDDNIDKKNGLVELIQEYPLGSTVKLTYQRQGQELSADIALKQYK